MRNHTTVIVYSNTDCTRIDRLTVVSDSPVVTEVPTANVSRCLKDRSSSASTSRPALVSGKKAWRRVPRYALPGFGMSGSEKEERGVSEWAIEWVSG